MKNTLPAKRFPLSARPIVTFCLLSCIFSFLLPSVALAGSIAAWGDNSVGQCNIPEPNAGFVAIAAGCGYSLGLKSDGSIVAWGDNSSGQCNIPPPNSGFTAIAAGGAHYLGLKSDGSIVVWGNGQCNVPGPNTGFVAISTGVYHSLALKSDGSIVAWGDNGFGQCNVPSPNTEFVAIAAGFQQSLGLKYNGSIIAWGRNNDGQCNVPSPNTGFVAISAGFFHSLGLKSDGSIVAWGDNYYGQCTVPSPNTDFIAISAGGFEMNYSLGLKSDGSIVGWGDNFTQATPPVEKHFTAISAGGDSFLALGRCPFSDLNGDAFVDFIDYAIFARDWQQTVDPCDPNNGNIIKDNQVNIYDLAELVELWLTCFVEPSINPNPADNTTNTSTHVVLQWQPGDKSTSHDVYFGTDFNTVNNADIAGSGACMGNQDANFWDINNFDSNGLKFNTTYYWRIDEVAAGCTAKGDVWSFMTLAEIDPNLVAWWKFDEVNGTTAYDSAGTNNGTLQNGPVWTPGKLNGALSFDGSNDYVNIPYSSSLDLKSQATLSAWINTKSLTAPQGIVGRWNYAGGPPYKESILLEARGDVGRTIRFWISTNNQQSGETCASSIQQFSANTWYHVAGTYDGATMKLYINGQLESSTPKTGNIYVSNSNWCIGAFNYAGVAYFNGLIDDVRVYNRALTADEIAQLYAK